MSVSSRIAQERQNRLDERMEVAKTVVPAGLYCYAPGPLKTVMLEDGSSVERMTRCKCPYWKRNGHKSHQRDGYCKLLKSGDWMPHPHGTFLLFDQVKECGINLDEPDVID